MSDLEIYISETTIELESVTNTDCLVYDLDYGNWTHLANTPAESVCIWTGGTDSHEFFIGTSGGTGFIYQLTTGNGEDDTQESGVNVSVNSYVTTGVQDFGLSDRMKQMYWALGVVEYGSGTPTITLDYNVSGGTSFTTGPIIMSASKKWRKVRWTPDSSNLRGMRWTYKANFPGSSLTAGDMEIISFSVGYRVLELPTDDYSA